MQQSVCKPKMPKAAARTEFAQVQARTFASPEEFMRHVERALRAHRMSKGASKRILKFFGAYLHFRQQENEITERTYELLSGLLMRALSHRQHRAPEKIIRDIKQGAGE
ncbi:MAG: hypothetical protein N3H30_00375 [Candidatus Micrarchaeota archaeon]|nr:hypothetical protein [Candidatus Micrarchaeota archaeon]